MATTASGPTMAGGTQPIVKEGYELLYLPDVHNDALQREGKAPVYYYLPNYVHIARKNGQPDGDFMFNLIRFAGLENATGDGSAAASTQVAGGVLTFTVTSAPPDSVLQASQQQIIDQYNASSDFFWGIRTQMRPLFRPVPIVANYTSVSNVAPLPNGEIPAIAPDGPRAAGAPPMIRGYTTPPSRSYPRTVKATRDGATSSSLAPWFWQMQGQGNGSIDPGGQNAYSALLGAYPTAIVWQAFHGAASPIVVFQNLKIKMWAPLVEISIRGRWRRVFEHFSAAVHAHYLWASADIKAEFNKMRTNGDIEVIVSIDPTIPGGAAIQQAVDKKTDLVFQKFMEQAQKMIFEPPMPQVQAAEASSGGGLWGVGVALKWRRDETDLELNYHEKQEFAYLQDTTISSSLEGMAGEIQLDPNAEKKYFLSVYLDDWPRKIGRIAKPIVNWAQPDKNWVGDPVAFASVQIGYPNTSGEIMWDGTTFQKTDPVDRSWNYAMTQKPLADVANPPAGWAPDQTFVKRKIHLLEPPDATANPFVRVQIDRNEIDLDPDPSGTLTNDIAIEVRADSAGKLALGPISLGRVLDDSRQTVEVLMEATDNRGQPGPREGVRFQWNLNDQDTPRFWSIYTGDPDLRAFFRYKVRVVVKGSLFTDGMEWEGPWTATSGNGPLIVSVPKPTDPGVVQRELPSFLTAASTPPPAKTNGYASGAPTGAPPAARDTTYRTPGNGERTVEVAGWKVDVGAASKSKDAPPAARGQEETAGWRVG